MCINIGFVTGYTQSFSIAHKTSRSRKRGMRTENAIDCTIHAINNQLKSILTMKSAAVSRSQNSFN